MNFKWNEPITYFHAYIIVILFWKENNEKMPLIKSSKTWFTFLSTCSSLQQSQL